MAKKKVEIFIDILSERDFKYALKVNAQKLICAEIYCNFAGSCAPLYHLFTKLKFEWSTDDEIALLKIPADEIEVFERFRHHSEPIFLFIVDRKITKIFRGVDGIGLEAVAKKEIQYFRMKKQGLSVERPTYELDEATPEEVIWKKTLAAEKSLEEATMAAKQMERQAARKRHRAELMVPYLGEFNFVLFWPHCKHAHYELYERWDMNNIIMVGREELELTKDEALDILYAGDAPINEASMHMLLSGPALVICFRLLDTDKHFVSLVRKILYEEVPRASQVSQHKMFITAFDKYKTFSPTREQVMKRRREDLHTRRENKKEQRARRLSEMQRLAMQAIDEALQAKRAAREQKKLDLLRTGNLDALNQLKKEPEDDDVGIVVPEELSDVSEDEASIEEDKDEYFPPAGLPIPGFYAPPTDVAKTNGLALMFPKIVEEHVTPEPEFLPPHVLVMLSLTKRYKAVQALHPFSSLVIHMGIFRATTPFKSTHIAYSVKQFDKMNMSDEDEEVKLVYMVSIERDRALLSLMDLSPVYVSKDSIVGEIECGAMFPVDYGDDYPDLEDFD